MTYYYLALAVLIVIFGSLIHVAFKLVKRRVSQYEGITSLEALAILFGSIPGFAGCASGFVGFGFPLPLIAGVPLHLLLLGNPDCGWTQVLYFGEPVLDTKYAAAPAIWLVTNILVIAALYQIKRKQAEGAS